MSGDNTKPVGYDTLREAMTVLIEHEQAKRRETRSSRGKLSLPKPRRFRATETVTGALIGLVGFSGTRLAGEHRCPNKRGTGLACAMARGAGLR